ncbi:MAG: hypothetical protein HOW73_24045 [Polyangiaceae bacterium]|nr:hypothetical protein [Polyangiaceae bacterium]
MNESDTKTARSLEDVARISAELDVATDADALLASLGIAADVWTLDRDRTLEAITDDLYRGDTSRSDKFGAAYDARRAELMAGQPAVSRAVGTAESNAAPGDPPNVRTPLPSASRPQLATFQRADVVTSSPDFDPDATAQVDNRRVLDGLRSKGIPFAEGAPVVVPPATPVTHQQSGETVVTDARDLHAALRARGIAIGGDPPSVSRVPTASPGATSLHAPPPPPIPGSPDQTSEIDATKLAAALAARGIPFGREAAPQLPMPLERFAEIQAALTRSQDRIGVLAYFRVTAAQWTATLQQMGAAMTASPALGARYEELLRKALQHGR